MSEHPEITALIVESVFGQQDGAYRFANFCNAVIVAETGGVTASLPILSEKPGADGSFDGEWNIPITGGFSNPFAEIGWNIFQFKARGIGGSGRKKAVSDLKGSLKETLEDLVVRLKEQKKPSRYTLFTNLQLGLETQSTTRGGSTLSGDRADLKASIRGESASETNIEIVDAGQLAAIVNKHPALRLTYFTPSVARSWSEKWEEEKASKNYKVSVPLVGREKELEQLSAWIADATVKVIAICGPSGMGKTRLALEATKRDEFRTTIVDIPDELERIDVQSLATSELARIVIVEDPTEGQAIRLAKQAVTTNGTKLIFTFPSEAKAPQLKLTEHESVKQMALKALDSSQSKQLLESTSTRFDSAALDWIVRQAGGVPEILLSAAELGSALRDKSGDLKERLTASYRKRITNELGRDAVGTLRLLSPLHWASVSGKQPDLPVLLDTIGKGLNVNIVSDNLKPLEQMGYLRRRGDYVSVVPPLFAAALSEDVFTTDTAGVCELFDKLADNSRKRLLERVITTDLPEQASFWNYVFENNLGNVEQVVANLDLLNYLARAIPARTGRFLESNIEVLADTLGTGEYNWKRSTFLSTLRELAYEAQSCASGMRLIQTMALREEWQKKPSSATTLFCECFVHWYYAFPLSFQYREQWIKRMLASNDPRERRLAARVVVMVTAPPRSLSAYSVHARRLGEQPTPRMWKDVWDYLEHLIEIRFELALDADDKISELAQEGFVVVFQEAHIPADRNVFVFEKFLEWQRAGKIKEDERKTRQVIHRIEKRYLESSQRPEQAEQAEKWKTVLNRLDGLRRRFDDGPFELRLKIALGRAYAHDWESTPDGKRVYGYQRRCQTLADEAVRNPELMTDAVWNLLRDHESYNAITFLCALGTVDRDATFLSRIEDGIDDERGGQHYGLYLSGIREHNPELVESRLDELVKLPDLPKNKILSGIEITGPTPGNRRRLLHLIEEESVEPFAVARMFTGGRWLQGLPALEVRRILEFISTGDSEWPKWVVDVLSVYLHPDKPLPAELFPIAEQALREVKMIDDHVEWNCERVAIGIALTDLDKAFQILADQIAKMKHSDATRQLRQNWVAFDPHGSNDFWNMLRTASPDRAYRGLLELRGKDVRGEIGLVLDLERHREILLKIAQESESNAVFLCKLISGVQEGFFLFAYGIMQLFPNDASVQSNLTSVAIYSLGYGIGDGDYSQLLKKIAVETENASTPKQFLPWLDNLTKQIDIIVKRDRMTTHDDYYLGWD